MLKDVFNPVVGIDMSVVIVFREVMNLHGLSWGKFPNIEQFKWCMACQNLQVAFS